MAAPREESNGIAMQARFAMQSGACIAMQVPGAVQTRVAALRGVTLKEMREDLVDRATALSSAENAGVLYLKAVANGGAAVAAIRLGDLALAHLCDLTAARRAVLAFLGEYRASGMDEGPDPCYNALSLRLVEATVAVTGDAVRLIINSGGGYSGAVRAVVAAHVEASVEHRLLVEDRRA